jgi:hypothetical protein
MIDPGEVTSGTDTTPLTCWSCTEYRMGGCLRGIRGWPRLGPFSCRRFDYAPGTDERERPPEVRATTAGAAG